MFLVFDVIGL